MTHVLHQRFVVIATYRVTFALEVFSVTEWQEGCPLAGNGSVQFTEGLCSKNICKLITWNVEHTFQ